MLLPALLRAPLLPLPLVVRMFCLRAGIQIVFDRAYAVVTTVLVVLFLLMLVVAAVEGRNECGPW